MNSCGTFDMENVLMRRRALQNEDKHFKSNAPLYKG